MTLSGFVDFLFLPRRHPGNNTEERDSGVSFPFEWMDGLVLTVYTAILAWDLYHHVGWIDEAQAWLIARDTTMSEMLFRRLHYEGAPALWPLILKAAVGLHLPFSSAGWIGGGFALTGIFVWLRCSPFPRVFRWLLPFTFFLQYQYAVVARPYVLFPLFLFAVCITYTLRKPRPILFACAAGLLANVNAHTAILSCWLALVYVYDLYRRGELSAVRSRKRVAVAACLFTAFCMASVGTAFPAPDAMVVPNATGEVKPASWPARLIAPERMPAGVPPLDPSLGTLAAREHTKTTSMFSSPPPPPTLMQRLRHRAHGTLLVASDLATYPLASSHVLSVGFLLAFAAWLWSRRSLHVALPWLLTLPAAASIWVLDHHTGIFLLALVAACWICLVQAAPDRGSRVFSVVLTLFALIVTVLQIGWTVRQIDREATIPYDPGKATEQFLAGKEAGKRIAAFTPETVAIQPYVDRNLFSNQQHSYWIWSNAVATDLRRTETLATRPDVIVAADNEQGSQSLYNEWRMVSEPGTHYYAEMARYWEQHGYRETHRFCGARSMRAGISSTSCDLIFEPTAPPTQRGE